jgi:hypothetical protein
MLGLVRTDALQFSPQPWPRLLPASSPPPGEMRPCGVRSRALLLAQRIGGDAQALHQFADRIPQIYPSLSPSYNRNRFSPSIAIFLDTKDTIDLKARDEMAVRHWACWALIRSKVRSRSSPLAIALISIAGAARIGYLSWLGIMSVSYGNKLAALLAPHTWSKVVPTRPRLINIQDMVIRPRRKN